MNIREYMCVGTWKPEEGIESPGNGFTVGYKLLSIGTRNQTQDLCKSSKALNH